MFIDNPTVPTQLEVLLDLLYAIRQKNAPVDTVKVLLQPTGLPDLNPKRDQSLNHLHAARELGLIAKDDEGNERLNYSIREGRPTAREAIIEAFDRTVLTSPTVEPWFARLYGYVISSDAACIPPESGARGELCATFNAALPGHIDRGNQLNPTKLGQYVRWYTYTGMAWLDPAARLIPDPTVRLRRSLSAIFDKTSRLDAGSFMASLSQVCPELDGGALFMDVANQFNPADRVCTRALAVALRNLHDEGSIQLECPIDSQGWSLERGGTVRDQLTLQSDRFDRISMRLPVDRT